MRNCVAEPPEDGFVLVLSRGAITRQRGQHEHHQREGGMRQREVGVVQVARGGAQRELEEQGDEEDEGGAAEGGVVPRGGGGEGIGGPPASRKKCGDEAEEGEEELRREAVDEGERHAEAVVGGGGLGRRGDPRGEFNAYSPEDALGADEKEHGAEEWLHPESPIDREREKEEDEGGEPDERAEEPVGVLVEDAPGHARERVEEHRGAEGSGPVRHGQPGVGAGHERPREQHRQRRGDRDHPESSQPAPRIRRARSGGWAHKEVKEKSPDQGCDEREEEVPRDGQRGAGLEGVGPAGIDEEGAEDEKIHNTGDDA